MSPTLVNIFLDHNITDALDKPISTVSIGRHTFTNVTFTDVNGKLVRNNQKLTNLVKHLDETSSRHSVEISAEKTISDAQPATNEITAKNS